MSLRIFLSSLLIITTCWVKGQYKVQGKIIDDDSGLPVAAVSISRPGNNKSTISNDRGEFVLEVDTLPCEIGLFHIGYDRSVVSAESSFLNIKLKAAKFNLNTVTITVKNPADILKQAWKKADETIGLYSFGRAFYRQLTSLDSVPHEIFELFYDIKWDVNRINGWYPLQARYAKIPSNVIPANNTSYLNFLFSGYLFDFWNARYPHPRSLNRLYNVKLERMIEHADQDIAVISCVLKEKKNKGFWVKVNAVFYVGLEDYNIYQVESTVDNIPYSPVDLGSRFAASGWKGSFSATAKFARSKDFSVTVLNNLETQLNLIYIDKDSSNNVSIKSLLTVFEEKPELIDLNFVTTNEFTLDFRTVRRTAYNPEFWKGNEIVKRTPLENDFISLMENSEAFGTMSKKTETQQKEPEIQPK